MTKLEIAPIERSTDDVELDAGQLLTDARVPAVQLCGSPGSGKTTLLEATIRRLAASAQISVIVAHLAANRDATRLNHAGAVTVPLEVAALNSALLQKAIDSVVVSPGRTDLLMIETPGQMFNAPQPKIGHAARVAVFSITGGDDKAMEYPDRVRDCDLVVLTKLDLLPHVKFDMDVFRNDVKKLNPRAALIELSIESGAGMDAWVDWLFAHTLRVRTSMQAPATPECAEWWFG